MFETLLNDFTGTFHAIPPEVAAMRLLVAVLLGGLIGFEREVAAKPAGLRTHMMISMAACLFILVSQELSHLSFKEGVEVRTDPLRLIESVTAGVAFLAAGAIFTAKGTVKNLTTGASMWLAGAVGLCCGAGRLPLALIAAVISLGVLLIVSRLEAAAPFGKTPEHLKGREEPAE